ncbi:hypothetical protein Ancab_035306 [Ancistrocladus abbreviatus]
MSWAGDWMCGACQHMNFKKRDSCQKCGFSKFGTQGDVSAYTYNRTEVLAGDWYCQGMSCGAHNYASRTSCFKCGALKTDYMLGSGGFGSENLIPGWKTGDWICPRPGCGVHNYASRKACFKCETPKDFGGAL